MMSNSKSQIPNSKSKGWREASRDVVVWFGFWGLGFGI